MAFPLSGLVTVYTNQVPFESDVLRSSSYRMADIGKLSQTVLGTGLNNTPLFCDLACTPVSPPGLQVVVGPGCAYAYEDYQATSWSVLPADTDPNHKLFKQGLSLDPVTLNTPAPTTSGNSVIHLVQAKFQTTDENITSRPYFNSTNPAEPIFESLSDTRVDGISILVKLGTESPSPVAPSPDAGYTALYHVHVTFGQTAIVSGDITKAPNAPFITESLTQKIGAPAVQTNYYNSGLDTGTVNTIVVTPNLPYESYTFGSSIWVKVANTNTGASTININGLGAVGIRRVIGTTLHNLLGGELVANGVYELIYDGTYFQVPSLFNTPSLFSEVILGSSQTITGSILPILFDTVPTGGDPYGWWDQTNHRMSPGISGRFQITGKIECINTGVQDDVAFLEVFLNGSNYRSVGEIFLKNNSTGVSITPSLGINLLNSSDYIDLRIRTSGGTAGINVAGPVGPDDGTIFQLTYLGPLK